MAEATAAAGEGPGPGPETMMDVIRRKPILVFFSHGTTPFETTEGRCERISQFKLPARVQQLIVSSPGDKFYANKESIEEFVRSPTSRTDTLEPMFALRYQKTLPKKEADYSFLDKKKGTEEFRKLKASPFEFGYRATGGTTIGDIRYNTIEKDTNVKEKLFGLWVFPADKTPPYRISFEEMAGKSEEWKLSQFYEWLQTRKELWNPEVGVAFVSLTCNTLYNESKNVKRGAYAFNVYNTEGLLDICDRLLRIYEEADDEYKKLPLVKTWDRKVIYPIFSQSEHYLEMKPIRSSNLKKHAKELKSLGITEAALGTLDTGKKLLIREWLFKRQRHEGQLLSTGKYTHKMIEKEEMPKWIKMNPPPAFLRKQPSPAAAAAASTAKKPKKGGRRRITAKKSKDAKA